MSNKDIGFLVNKPVTSSSLAAIGGGLLGAAGGFVGGNWATRGLHRDWGMYDGGTAGTIGGAAVGGLLGILMAARARRKKMRGIAEQFDAAEMIQPSEPIRRNPLRNVFLPYGAPHHAGHSLTADALSRGEAYKPGTGRNLYDSATYAASYIPYAGDLAILPMLAAGGIHGDMRARRNSAALRG